MDYRRIYIALIPLVIAAIAGCENKSNSSKSDPIKSAPKSTEVVSNGLPSGWDSGIMLAKAETPEGFRVALTGKKVSFKGIIEPIRGNVSKPINFGAGVDTEQILPEIEIKLAEGSWSKLLTLVAEKFDCVVEESNSEFLIVHRK